MKNFYEENKSRPVGQTNKGFGSSQKGKKGGQKGLDTKVRGQELMPEELEQNMEETSTIS